MRLRLRLKIELVSDRPIVLPASYGAYQQALIYNLLDSFDAQWLHDRGFVYDKCQEAYIFTNKIGTYFYEFNAKNFL